MLRVVPIVLAIAVCFLNLAFISLDSHKNYSEPAADAYTLHNHLTQDNNAQAAPINTVQTFEDVTENPVKENAAFVPRTDNILRLYWNITPNAVKYEILIDGATLYAYTNGIEIPVSNLSAKFQVNALSLEATRQARARRLSLTKWLIRRFIPCIRGYRSTARIITRLNL